MKKHKKENKKQKGITLIALIITIIVMLILVGVSVTVALNGGLFKTAKQASKGTEEKRDEELALSDGKVEINGEVYNSIEEYINKKDIPEELKRYVLGADLTGRPISEIYSSNSFKDDEATDEGETQTIPIEYLFNAPNEDNTEKYVYGNYNNTVYRIAYNTDTKLTIPEKTKAIYTPTGREGQDLGTVTGNSKYNEWIILYDYGSKVEAVAPFTSDERLKLSSYLNNGSEDDARRAIETYNKAIELINDYVKAETTTYNKGEKITDYTKDGTLTGVRSIGVSLNPVKESDVFSSDALSTIRPSLKHTFLMGDLAYKADLTRYFYFCGEARHNSFWIASRYILQEHNRQFTLCIRNYYDPTSRFLAITNSMICVCGYSSYMLPIISYAI